MPRRWAALPRSVPVVGATFVSSPPRSARRRSWRWAPAAAPPASGCSGHAPRRRAHQRRRRTRASAARPQGVHGGRFRGQPLPPHQRRALDVLPRLTDGGYDMVFCDAAKQEYLDYLAEASGCCGPAGSWRSTTRYGAAGSPIPRQATRAGGTARAWRGGAGRWTAGTVLLPVGDGLLRRSTAA